MVSTAKRQPNKIMIVLVGLLAFMIGMIAFQVGLPTKPSYKFVTTDHPVNMWKEEKDKWAYFYIGGKSLADLAAKARSELIPQGFTEDTTKKPWVCFVKGTEEVVVCNHQDFAVNSGPFTSKLTQGYWPKGITKPTQDVPCVLVKNGPGTEMNPVAFSIKKLIFGW